MPVVEVTASPECATLISMTSLLFIRMYRYNMFGHFDKSGPPKKSACVVGHRAHMSCCIVSLPHAFGKLSLKRQMSR